MAELDRAAIAVRLGQARAEAGLDQRELAELLEVHWRTIQNWESPKKRQIPWDRLDEIARITNRTREWLLHGDPPEPDLTNVQAVLDDIRGLLDQIEQHLREDREPPPADDEPR